MKSLRINTDEFGVASPLHYFTGKPCKRGHVTVRGLLLGYFKENQPILRKALKYLSQYEKGNQNGKGN